MKLALAALLLAKITIPSGPHSRQDAIRTMAETHAVVLAATTLCDDLFGSE